MDNALELEKVKNYWNNRPCNIRHSPSPVGTKQYFDEVEARKYFVEPHIPGFAEFDKWKGKKVLEIGCGIGTDTMNFARAGADVTAVDLSQASVDLAKKRAEVFGLKNIKFYVGNAEELSKFVPVEKYDLIYSFGVIHHTPTPENVISEMKKYSNPGTVVKVMVYYRHSWKVGDIILKYGHGAFWKLDKLIPLYSEAQYGSPVTYTYTPETAAKLLDGYEVTEVFADHIFPYRIPEYVKYQYVKVWYFRWMPDSWFHAFERKFGWHLCVTAVQK
jgi:ubiquinone/menaquinone biosynthesis C-methylase UbiE